jgi:hypothetical protein
MAITILGEVVGCYQTVAISGYNKNLAQQGGTFHAGFRALACGYLSEMEIILGSFKESPD